MTAIDLGRPVSGDVVELILDDHRRFEALLRDLRDSSSDRDAVRHAFATLHVAHATAEEQYVYPKLRRKDAITEHEADHGEEEHAEGHEALLAVLEQVRAELGEAFANERNRQVDDNCGTLTNVRRIVAEARREGLLDDDEE
jgi:hemerythrin superfamily protein